MKYKKKPIVVEASQWFKIGDHAEVKPYHDNSKFLGYTCDKCFNRLMDHGQVSTLEGNHIVCPGDWIICGVQNEFYPCKPDIFEATYDEAE